MIYESRRFQTGIAKQVITPWPVFIIGHWRSGTTYLQNLLSEDRQFGRVSLLQAAMPHEFLTLPAIARDILNRILPDRRIMDNVRISLDMPWEEEMAIVSYCPYSFYHVSFFPQNIESIFRRTVLFKGVKSREIESWKGCYLHFLKKVQYTQPGKRLLLKNPANTARLGLLRQLFPGAKFIFLHRHPCEVYASTMNLYTKVQSAWGLQTLDRERLSRYVIWSYRELMNAYFLQRRDLDRKDLIEVSYHDLVSNPLTTVKDIYEQLELETFETAESDFIYFIRQQKNYVKNELGITGPEKSAVFRGWKNTFIRYGYSAC